ncbi:hypothetical protein SDC9_192662 [bioreactor metagenome]|uniref:Uncharacterized protein n=1 Tax=bioreactor metagenome TaxID=1076179 RepID=A0A645I1E1_9ZZZZ
MRRQPLEHHGRAGLETDGVGQLAHIHCRHHTHFAVAARRLARIGRAIAHLQVRDAITHGLDHARRLHADTCGHLQRIQARAVVHVDEVQADGLVADADLAGARLANLHIDKLQLFGTTMLTDLNGEAHGTFLLGCCVITLMNVHRATK